MEAVKEKLKARIVRVRYEKGGSSLLYATSPDLKGLLVAERTWEELERAIPQAIEDLYAASGEDVVVTSVEEVTQDGGSWVAFPVAVAARALSERRN